MSHASLVCFTSVVLLKNSRCSPQVGNRNQFIKVFRLVQIKDQSERKEVNLQ